LLFCLKCFLRALCFVRCDVGERSASFLLADNSVELLGRLGGYGTCNVWHAWDAVVLELQVRHFSSSRPSYLTLWVSSATIPTAKLQDLGPARPTLEDRHCFFWNSKTAEVVSISLHIAVNEPSSTSLQHIETNPPTMQPILMPGESEGDSD